MFLLVGSREFGEKLRMQNEKCKILCSVFDVQCYFPDSKYYKTQIKIEDLLVNDTEQSPYSVLSQFLSTLVSWSWRKF